MHHAPQHRYSALALFASVTMMLVVSMPSAGAQTAEYQVKAVFISKFASFVSWPEGTFASPTSPIVIGIYGESPFGTSLAEALKGEVVDGRQLVSRTVNNLDEARTCQILFVPQGAEEATGELLSHLSGDPVLTVGDDSEQVAQGAIIGFALQDGRVKLLISPRAATAANLQIKAKLLRLAKIAN